MSEGGKARAAAAFNKALGGKPAAGWAGGGCVWRLQRAPGFKFAHKA